MSDFFMKGPTVQAVNYGGVPMFEHNVTLEGEGFYVSYNNRDIADYGCATTALVLGQMQHFYILNGDHRKEYAALVPLGFGACKKYFDEAKASHKNKYSEE